MRLRAAPGRNPILLDGYVRRLLELTGVAAMPTTTGGGRAPP